MRHVLRFVLPLVLLLALFAWGGAAAVTATTRSWFLHDLARRSELAVSSAEESLGAHWRAAHREKVRALLNAIAADERVMAAGACSLRGEWVARSEGFPAGLTCSRLREEAAPDGTSDRGTRTALVPLAGGEVHVSLVPVSDAAGPLGDVVLLHDMAIITHRENLARRFFVGAFGVLAVVASAFVFFAARFSVRRWLHDLRAFLAGDDPAAASYPPLARDVRDLVNRLASERVADAGGVWTPARLRQVLESDLQGERVVALANREPYIHERNPDGTVRMLHPASGLVTALEPVMRACSGTWIAHGSGSADRQTVDRHDHVAVPPEAPSYTLRRVWLTAEEERGYYYGFSNEGLWPLCHIAHARPVFRSEDFAHYREANRRFADAAIAEAGREDPVILVQDYHFALAPRMIREKLPRATIITFWHIPWPNAERFGICPWRNELLEGLLGSSILGFHVQLHCNNFLDSIDQLLEARIDREKQAVVQGGRPTLVRAYPISVEWPSRYQSVVPSAPECRAAVMAELGMPVDGRLGVGVDRLDYTKGIEERLLAVERLLDQWPAWRGRFTFVQLAAPSRTAIGRYQQLNDDVERLSARINERFARGNWRPIALLRAHHEAPTVFRYYRAADVCYVSSLHDGMNLVAKEFVSARDDERGVLVLSHFTGAARELTEALVVNPYDLDQASGALRAALEMPAEEQRARMRAMRSLVADYNIYRWAGRMLVDAARLRRRGALSVRYPEAAPVRLVP